MDNLDREVERLLNQYESASPDKGLKSIVESDSPPEGMPPDKHVLMMAWVHERAAKENAEFSSVGGWAKRQLRSRRQEREFRRKRKQQIKSDVRAKLKSLGGTTEEEIADGAFGFIFTLTGIIFLFYFLRVIHLIVHWNR